MDLEWTLLLIGISVILLAGFYYAAQSGNPGYPLLSVKNSDRVMVVAPHPDDEALAAAGVIKYCVDHNIPVEVVVVTNGGFKLAWERHSESLKAMELLGLNDNVTFLDYPQCLIYLLGQNWDKPCADFNGVSHSIDKFSHDLNVPYTGESLAGQLESVISDFKPTIIIYPDPNDVHLDHWATSAFVEYAITDLHYNCTTLGYMVHTPSSWPSPRLHSPGSYLTPPDYLRSEEKWVEFPLTEKEEKFKALAIESYKSQLKWFSSSHFLLSFSRRNELFSVQHPISLIESNLITIKNAKSGVETFDPSLTISSIGLQANKNGTNLFLQTKGRISPANIYEFHLLIIYRNNTHEVIDIQVKDGKCHQYGNKLSELKIINKTNSLIIETPIIFKEGDKIIIGADTQKKKGLP